MKAGGRNPEGIENVRVKLDKGSRESVKLGDVASVVFRGRNVGVLVGEKDVSSYPFMTVSQRLWTANSINYMETTVLTSSTKSTSNP